MIKTWEIKRLFKKIKIIRAEKTLKEGKGIIIQIKYNILLICKKYRFE
jgi:hypothetical protein